MQKLTGTEILFAVVLFFLFGACSEPKALYVHLPDRVNVPALKVAGEYKADVSLQAKRYDSDGIPFSYACDLAYSPISNLGLIASYRGLSNFRQDHGYGANNYNGYTGTEKFNLRSSIFDIGVGSCGLAGPKNIFEAYIGYGIGTIANKAYGGNDPGSYNGTFHRFFLQAEYGITLPDKTMFLFGFRTMYKKFDRFSLGAPTEIDSSAANQVRTKYITLLQPFLGLEAGKRSFKFNMQFGCQFYLQPYDGASHWGNVFDQQQGYIYSPPLVYVSLGITYHYTPTGGKSLQHGSNIAPE